MGLFAAGDIVIIPFPYSDLSKTKLRPALIVADLDNNEYILIQITSQEYDNKYTIKLFNSDLKFGTLKVNSYLKYSKIFTASESIFFKSIAKIEENKLIEVPKKITELINK